ncbi:MAG: hypothetical protein ACREAX_01460 [Candidatus Nitrosotenuis sp.]
MSDSDASPDEAEIIRIMTKMPEFSHLKTLEIDKIRHEITHKIADTLKEYYWENTRGYKTVWTEKFARAGITEDDGKAAISCARRLGINIS